MKKIALLFTLSFGLAFSQSNNPPFKKLPETKPLPKIEIPNQNLGKNNGVEPNSTIPKKPKYSIIVKKPDSSINYLALKMPKKDDSKFSILNGEKITLPPKSGKTEPQIEK